MSDTSGGLGLLLAAAAGAAPGSSPAATAGIAQASASPDDAAANAMAAAGYANAASWASALSSQAPALAAATYARQPASVQSQLQAAGYQPPPPPDQAAPTGAHHGGGFFSDLINNPVTRLVGKVASVPVLSDVLHTMGLPTGVEQHVERTALVVANQASGAATGTAGPGGLLGTVAGSVASALHLPGGVEASTALNTAATPGQLGHVTKELLNVNEWARAYDETANGTKYILPQVQRQVAAGMDPADYQLAYKEATGATPDQIVKAAAPADQPTVAAQLNNPDVQKAYAALMAGHVSVGRMLVGENFIVNHPDLGNALSGAIDATMDWYSDPVIIGTNLAKGAQTARFIVRNTTDANRLFADTGRAGQAVRAKAADMAQYVANGDFAGFAAKYPKQVPLWDGLKAAGADTGVKVGQHLASEAGVMAIIKANPAHVTNWAVRGSEDEAGRWSAAGTGDGGTMPYLSKVGQGKAYVKAQLMKPINFADDAPAQVTGLAPEDTTGGTGAPVTAIQVDAPNAVRSMGLNAANSARRFLTLKNRGDSFDLMGPNAGTQFRNIAMYGLTPQAADKLTNAFMATNDLGIRRAEYFGMMKELAQREGAGGSASELYDEYMRKFTSEAGDNAKARYAPGVIGDYDVNGDPTQVGILEGDVNNMVSVPNFNTYLLNTKKVGLLGRVVGPINADWLNKFMDPWRTLTLARIGFGLRAGGEEVARFVLAHDLRSYIAARVTGSSIRASERVKNLEAAAARTPEQVAADARDAAKNGTYNRMTGELSPKVLKDVVTPRQLVVAHMRDVTTRALANVAGRLSPNDYARGIRSLYDHDVFNDENFADRINAAHNPNGSFSQEVPLQKMMDGKLVNAEMAHTGAFLQHGPGDPDYIYAYHHQLSALANSNWARTSMQLRHGDQVVRANAVADEIQKYPEFWKQFVRSGGTRDGRKIATGEATAREAALDHAQAVNDLVDSAIYSPNGNEIDGLADHLLANRASPTRAALSEMDDDLRPLHVKGPERLAVMSAGPGGLLTALGNRLFERQIGPMMNWISRQPIFIHNYTVSLQATDQIAQEWLKSALSNAEIEAQRLHAKSFPSAGYWSRTAMNPSADLGELPRHLQPDYLAQNVAEMQHQAAMQRAMDLTTPYIHDPELKSQFSSVTRNLMPFWFAQEQFYKRWARTAVVAPWAFRKAQLINGGFQHSGLLHHDPQTGQEYFIYPASGAALDYLNHVTSLLGISATLPIPGALTGQVNQLNAGMERIGAPNFGPFVTAPLNQLKTMDPAFTGAIDKIEGSQSASAGTLKPFLPTTLQRVAEVAAPDAISSAQYASAQMQALQQLEASGHGIGQPPVNMLGQTNGVGAPHGLPAKPGDYVVDQGGTTYVMQGDGQWRQNSPQALQQEMNRVKNYTRNILLLRLVFGFSAPASPEMQFKPSNLNEDFQTAMKELPLNEALNAFTAQHPDATPYTVFQTKTQGGTVPPATVGAMNFMDNNKNFMDAHKQAGSFFLPQPDTSGDYSLPAYQEQLTEGMRIKKTPQEFADDVIYAMSAKTYFDQEDLYHKLIANMPTSSPQRQQLDAQWTGWSQQFQLTNPIFADQLASSTGSANRTQIMNDVGGALRDPRLPGGQTTDDVRMLYDNWAAWQSMTTATGGLNAPKLSTTNRNQLNLQFAQWASNYAADHPDVEALYNKAIRPSFSSTVLTQLAQQGA